MNDFIAIEDQALLERHGLATFEALWALELEAVDAPNTERGGWSSVCRLDLEGRRFYLKRQSNHLIRSARHPLGEPTFARELHNIQRYAQLGIPALQAAFFAQRRIAGEQCAILLTRALEGWHDLEHYLERWSGLTVTKQLAILHACGQLADSLQRARQVHGCFYPKHIFLRPAGDAYEACLIDLEKSRRIFGRRQRAKDLEPLLRRVGPRWDEQEVKTLLAASVPEPEFENLLKSLNARRRHKEKPQ